jgi:hypothetical protein
MWEPQPLTTLRASKACRGENFTFLPLERPRLTWKYGIKIDIREIGWGGMHWINLAQDSDQ